MGTQIAAQSPREPSRLLPRPQMACAELLEKHKAAWQAATQHRFLEDCRDGAIDGMRFDAWLVQVGGGNALRRGLVQV